MKIVIFSPTSTIITFDPKQPLGGADKALLRMIDSFIEEGHEVQAYIPVKESIGKYHPFMDIFRQEQTADVLIIYRKTWALPPVHFKKLVFYSQDLSDTPCFAGTKERNYFQLYDQVILLSQFHKQNFLEKYDYDENKIFILGNAAEETTILRERSRNKFMYCSTPFRGLVVLAKMWKTIVDLIPDAELHVYSSMAIYGSKDLDDLYFKPLFDKLSRMEGVHLHGSQPLEVVEKSMQECHLLLYPNTYPETYCNVINEARMNELPFITTNRGALKETGGEAGVYIEGDPYTETYQANFIIALMDLYHHQDKYGLLQSKCKPARDWIDYKKDLLRCINDL